MTEQRHRWGRPNMGGEQRCECGTLRVFVNTSRARYLPAGAQDWQDAPVPCTKEPRKPRNTSWGHAIARIADAADDKAFKAVYTEVRQVPAWWDQSRLIWSPSCAGYECPGKPEFVTRYLYVTGRAGRVTSRVQYVCREHGERFADKHGLEVPA